MNIVIYQGLINDFPKILGFLSNAMGQAVYAANAIVPGNNPVINCVVSMVEYNCYGKFAHPSRTSCKPGDSNKRRTATTAQADFGPGQRCAGLTGLHYWRRLRFNHTHD